MATYIAFLRAINLGATRKFPRGDIVAAVEGAGCADVETYINTGNVRLTSTLRSRVKVEALLEKAFADDRGFEVPTIVLTPAELSAVADFAQGLGHPGRQYVTLLKAEPTVAATAALEALSTGTEVIRVGGGRAVHLLAEDGFDGSLLTNKVVEKHLGVATTRNLTVIATLAERWGRG